MSALLKTQSADVAPDLFVWRGNEIRLLAGRDHKAKRLIFPLPEGDWQSLFEAEVLPRDGKLWTWTIQRFCPKPPYDGDIRDDDFEPFAVGYVEFADQIIVQGRLLLDDLSKLEIGMEMRTVAFPYRTLEDGSSVLTYAFEPVEAE